MDIKTKIILGEICETVGAVIAFLTFILAAWLFLLATPDQPSAEAEACAQEIEQAKEGAK